MSLTCLQFSLFNWSNSRDNNAPISVFFPISESKSHKIVTVRQKPPAVWFATGFLTHTPAVLKNTLEKAQRHMAFTAWQLTADS